MKMHPSITVARVCALAESSMFGMENPGLCIACGEEAEGVEPDGERYECESCGRRAVYGAEQLLLMTVA